MSLLDSFRAISARNLAVFKSRPLAEISGSLGDLGTFLPIAIALAVNGTISLSSTLVFSGVANILTGLFFGIPLPVQPMKAIAAVAIANSFSNGEIAAAGIFVAACVFVFSASGLLRWFAHVIPIPVVKGIQVGAGLSLIIAAGGSISNLGWVTPSWADNRVWAVVAFLFLLLTHFFRQIPYALVVLVVGLVFAIVRAAQINDDLPNFIPWIPVLSIPAEDDWRVGIVKAGIGQLPLTTLNSIVAVVHLASDLLPDVKTPSITSVGLSVAAMNLASCWFGAMPVCHGSGGLAAQYRFGARSGSSVVVLGVFKLLIGLFFGNTLVGLLKLFPYAFLGIMVIAAGLELASVGESLNTTGARDLNKVRHTSILGQNGQEIGPVLGEEERKRRYAVMMVTIGFLVGFKNDAVGFLAGLLCHASFELSDYIQRLQARGQEGRIQLTE